MKKKKKMGEDETARKYPICPSLSSGNSFINLHRGFFFPLGVILSFVDFSSFSGHSRRRRVSYASILSVFFLLLLLLPAFSPNNRLASSSFSRRRFSKSSVSSSSSFDGGEGSLIRLSLRKEDLEKEPPKLFALLFVEAAMLAEEAAPSRSPTHIARPIDKSLSASPPSSSFLSPSAPSPSPLSLDETPLRSLSSSLSISPPASSPTPGPEKEAKPSADLEGDEKEEEEEEGKKEERETRKKEKGGGEGEFKEKEKQERKREGLKEEEELRRRKESSACPLFNTRSPSRCFAASSSSSSSSSSLRPQDSPKDLLLPPASTSSSSPSSSFLSSSSLPSHELSAARLQKENEERTDGAADAQKKKKKNGDKKKRESENEMYVGERGTRQLFSSSSSLSLPSSGEKEAPHSSSMRHVPSRFLLRPLSLGPSQAADLRERENSLSKGEEEQENHRSAGEREEGEVANKKEKKRTSISITDQNSTGLVQSGGQKETARQTKRHGDSASGPSSSSGRTPEREEEEEDGADFSRQGFSGEEGEPPERDGSVSGMILAEEAEKKKRQKTAMKRLPGGTGDGNAGEERRQSGGEEEEARPRGNETDRFHRKEGQTSREKEREEERRKRVSATEKEEKEGTKRKRKEEQIDSADDKKEAFFLSPSSRTEASYLSSSSFSKMSEDDSGKTKERKDGQHVAEKENAARDAPRVKQWRLSSSSDFPEKESPRGGDEVNNTTEKRKNSLSETSPLSPSLTEASSSSSGKRPDRTLQNEREGEEQFRLPETPSPRRPPAGPPRDLPHSVGEFLSSGSKDNANDDAKTDEESKKQEKKKKNGIMRHLEEVFERKEGVRYMKKEEGLFPQADSTSGNSSGIRHEEEEKEQKDEAPDILMAPLVTSQREEEERKKGKERGTSSRKDSESRLSKTVDIDAEDGSPEESLRPLLSSPSASQPEEAEKKNLSLEPMPEKNAAKNEKEEEEEEKSLLESGDNEKDREKDHGIRKTYDGSHGESGVVDSSRESFSAPSSSLPSPHSPFPRSSSSSPSSLLPGEKNDLGADATERFRDRAGTGLDKREKKKKKEQKKKKNDSLEGDKPETATVEKSENSLLPRLLPREKQGVEEEEEKSVFLRQLISPSSSSSSSSFGGVPSSSLLRPSSSFSSSSHGEIQRSEDTEKDKGDKEEEEEETEGRHYQREQQPSLLRLQALPSFSSSDGLRSPHKRDLYQAHARSSPPSTTITNLLEPLDESSFSSPASGSSSASSSFSLLPTETPRGEGREEGEAGEEYRPPSPFAMPLWVLVLCLLGFLIGASGGLYLFLSVVRSQRKLQRRKKEAKLMLRKMIRSNSVPTPELVTQYTRELRGRQQEAQQKDLQGKEEDGKDDERHLFEDRRSIQRNSHQDLPANEKEKDLDHHGRRGSPFSASPRHPEGTTQDIEETFSSSPSRKHSEISIEAHEEQSHFKEDKQKDGRNRQTGRRTLLSSSSLLSSSFLRVLAHPPSIFVLHSGKISNGNCWPRREESSRQGASSRPAVRTHPPATGREHHLPMRHEEEEEKPSLSSSSFYGKRSFRDSEEKERRRAGLTASRATSSVSTRSGSVSSVARTQDEERRKVWKKEIEEKEEEEEKGGFVRGREEKKPSSLSQEERESTMKDMVRVESFDHEETFPSALVRTDPDEHDRDVERHLSRPPATSPRSLLVHEKNKGKKTLPSSSYVARRNHPYPDHSKSKSPYPVHTKNLQRDLTYRHADSEEALAFSSSSSLSPYQYQHSYAGQAGHPSSSSFSSCSLPHPQHRASLNSTPHEGYGLPSSSFSGHAAFWRKSHPVLVSLQLEEEKEEEGLRQMRGERAEERPSPCPASSSSSLSRSSRGQQGTNEEGEEGHRPQSEKEERRGSAFLQQSTQFFSRVLLLSHHQKKQGRQDSQFDLDQTGSPTSVRQNSYRGDGERERGKGGDLRAEERNKRSAKQYKRNSEDTRHHQRRFGSQSKRSLLSYFSLPPPPSSSSSSSSSFSSSSPSRRDAYSLAETGGGAAVDDSTSGCVYDKQTWASEIGDDPTSSSLGGEGEEGSRGLHSFYEDQHHGEEERREGGGRSSGCFESVVGSRGGLALGTGEGSKGGILAGTRAADDWERLSCWREHIPLHMVQTAAFFHTTRSTLLVQDEEEDDDDAIVEFDATVCLDPTDAKTNTEEGEERNGERRA